MWRARFETRLQRVFVVLTFSHSVYGIRANGLASVGHNISWVEVVAPCCGGRSVPIQISFERSELHRNLMFSSGVGVAVAS